MRLMHKLVFFLFSKFYDKNCIFVLEKNKDSLKSKNFVLPFFRTEKKIKIRVLF